MNRQGLIEKMRALNPGMTTKDAGAAIDVVFPAVRAALDGDAKFLSIPGFGTFRRRLRKARSIRNPATGETSYQLEHHVITFREARGK